MEHRFYYIGILRVVLYTEKKINSNTKTEYLTKNLNKRIFNIPDASAKVVKILFPSGF